MSLRGVAMTLCGIVCRRATGSYLHKLANVPSAGKGTLAQYLGFYPSAHGTKPEKPVPR